MEEWARFLLYGTYNGFSRSTDGDNNIIMILDNGEKVEMPEYLTRNASDFVEKNKIKLKDVIARIEKFDLATKAVWINEILYKLGSDYGLHKYYAGYKQGKFDGAMGRGKVTVPQIVADYIKYTKEIGWDLQEAMDDVAYEDNKDLRKWFNNNIEIFARAWLDGYRIEKEKKYTVKLKNTDDYLVKTAADDYRFYSNIYTQSRKHTKEEIEKGGFGWVFDCEGIEIEEVE